MKRTILILSCLAVFSVPSSQINAATSYPVKILFKWSGLCPPHCGPGCGQPLGICVILGFAFGPVSPAEFAEGFGIADIDLDVGNNVHLVFHRDAALADSTIHITQDFFIGPEVSSALGYDSVIISQGIYDVDFSIHPQHGEATFHASLIGPHIAPIPTLTEWGMIIFCALLFAWMAWVLVQRRKRISMGM